MTVLRRAWAIALSVALCLGAVGLGYAVRAMLPGLGTAPAAAQAGDATTKGTKDVEVIGTPAVAYPEAVAEMWVKKGKTYGRVFIGETVVIRCIFSHYGVEPFERARIAADSINLALQEGAQPEDFRAAMQGRDWFVVAGEQAIIGIASPQEPQGWKQSAPELAEKWASQITAALRASTDAGPAGDVVVGPLMTEVRELTVAGVQVGVLLVNGREVLRLSTGAAGMTAYERATMAAAELKQAVAQGARAADIRAANVYGMSVVQVSETLLVTVSEEDAAAARKTPGDLADEWARGLSDAVADHYATASRPAHPGAWAPEEPYRDKWVPILSILQGTRIGMARVNGPSSRVGLVQACAQIELEWKNKIEIDVYIPISTKVPGRTIDRVQAVGVTGLGDLRL